MEADTEPLSLDTLKARHIRWVMERTHRHKGMDRATLGVSCPALERKLGNTTCNPNT